MTLVTEEDLSRYRNSLYHHGIAGQKWGRKNGPPYPLGSSQKSSAEKKAEKNEDPGVSKFKSSRRISTVALTLNTVSAMAALPASALFGPGGAMAAVAAQVASYTLIAVAMKQQRDAEREFADSFEPEKVNVKDLKKKESPGTAITDMKACNEDFPAPGTTENCTFCTAAFDMRRRGYDVRAQKTTEAQLRTKTLALYKNPDVKQGNLKAYKEFLSDTPDNSWGHLFVSQKYAPVGHDVAWCKENGKTRIYDCQSGKSYTIDSFMDLFDRAHVEWFRTDNLEIDEKEITRAVRKA